MLQHHRHSSNLRQKKTEMNPPCLTLVRWPDKDAFEASHGYMEDKCRPKMNPTRLAMHCNNVVNRRLRNNASFGTHTHKMCIPQWCIIANHSRRETQWPIMPASEYNIVGVVRDINCESRHERDFNSSTDNIYHIIISFIIAATIECCDCYDANFMPWQGLLSSNATN